MTTIQRGKPGFKYKHGRALTGAERIKALRAKQTLTKYAPSHPKYKKALAQLEEIYSEGVNPHEPGAIRDRYGQTINIHGYGYESTPAGREDLIWEEQWARRERHRRPGAGRTSIYGQPMTSRERTYRSRMKRKK